jgi:hypothetical protein
MAESTLSLTYWDLRREVARSVGIGNVFQTGTVTSAASTTMTLTNGVWPEWTAGATLVNKSTGDKIAVTTRSSDTVLVMASSSTWTGVSFELYPWDQSLEDQLSECLAEGYRRFLMPPPTQNRKKIVQWSFLSPQASLTTTAPYTTGTVTVSSGVVTLTGGTFPSWAASGELILGAGNYSGNRYSINTRDSTTQITLDDTTITDATARTFNLVRSAYDLPDDWAGFIGEGFTYRPGASFWRQGIVRQIGMVQVDMLRDRRSSPDAPTVFGLRPKTFQGSVGTRWEVVFDPAPNAAYILDYYYRAQPNMMTATNPIPYGGMLHSATLMSSCLAVAEERFNDQPGPHRAQFQERLMSSIDLDELQSAPRTLGVDRRRFSEEYLREHQGLVSYPVTSTYETGFFLP